MEYFVSPDRAAENDGSAASPWSLIKGISMLEAGDVLYLRDGTYVGRVRLQGKRVTPTNPIVIRSYPGEHATIDGTIEDFREAPNDLWEGPFAHGEYVVSWQQIRALQVWQALRTVLVAGPAGAGHGSKSALCCGDHCLSVSHGKIPEISRPAAWGHVASDWTALGLAATGSAVWQWEDSRGTSIRGERWSRIAVRAARGAKFPTTTRITPELPCRVRGFQEVCGPPPTFL
jgi:hypothetical protein